MKFPFDLIGEAEFDAVSFGTNAVDFLVRVPEYPAFNSKVELIDYVQAAGGEAATTAVGLQRLRLNAAYVGKFGDDESGKFGLASLRDEGVDVSYTRIVGRAKTQIAFIIIDNRNGERTVIWQRDERLAFAKDDVPIDAMSRTKVLHFTPHDVEACLELAKEARSRGVIVSSDVDNVFDGIEELLPYVDILVTSADFPRKLLGDMETVGALTEMRSRYGCGIVGVTLGEAGSMLLCENTFIETPGFPVPGGCKDTTGAGDSFRVGLIYGMLRGETVENAARMANAVASLKCRAVGARTALPTPDELAELLAK
jgi:sugar/nucleoside kinase (ribokinase family)